LVVTIVPSNRQWLDGLRVVIIRTVDAVETGYASIGLPSQRTKPTGSNGFHEVIIGSVLSLSTNGPLLANALSAASL
jgi:hypothetical protein